MTQYHPHKDDKGQLVLIRNPSKSTEQSSWTTPSEIATVTPSGLMPTELNGVAFTSWSDAPITDEQWANVGGQHNGLFDEPIFTPTKGKFTAAGVVIEEDDGRVWVVHPSNAFGGYQATFPKGIVGHGASLQSAAIREAFEESGLQVVITGFLADSERSKSKARYYLARRVGGSPSAMGWESQATSLVPLAMLGQVLTHPNDAPLVKALQQEKRPAWRDIIKYEFGLASGRRILSTINGFRRKYGEWPSRLLMDKGMADAIKAEILTPLGWALLASKLELVRIEEGTLFAENSKKQIFEYDADHTIPPASERADVWLWGIKLDN